MFLYLEIKKAGLSNKYHVYQMIVLEFFLMKILENQGMPLEICTAIFWWERVEVGKSESESVLRILDNEMYILFLKGKDGKD